MAPSFNQQFIRKRPKNKLLSQALKQAQLITDSRRGHILKASDFEIKKPEKTLVNKYTEVYFREKDMLLKQYAPFRLPKVWTEKYPTDKTEPLVILH